MIPMCEVHLRSILREWTTNYNRGRPHSALGPGVQDPPRESEKTPKSESRHRLAAGALVLAKSMSGGLHHECSIARRCERVISGLIESHTHFVSLANRPGYHVAQWELASNLAEVSRCSRERSQF